MMDAKGTVHLQLGLLQTCLTRECCPSISSILAVMKFAMTWLPICHLSVKDMKVISRWRSPLPAAAYECKSVCGAFI